MIIRLATVAALCVFATGGSAAASGPAAAVARTCGLSVAQQRSAGATYLVQLTTTGVSCSTGLKIEKAWQSCRRATAGRTTCRKSVLGYRSKQTILDSSKKQYDARVVATAGSRAVSFIYTQSKQLGSRASPTVRRDDGARARRPPAHRLPEVRHQLVRRR